jgi:hypothetical protein
MAEPTTVTRRERSNVRCRRRECGLLRAGVDWDRAMWEGAHGSSARTGGQFVLLDRKNLACFHLDAAYQAGTAADVFELGVIGAGCDAGDPQAFVGINGAVLVIFALIGTEIGGCRPAPE